MPSLSGLLLEDGDAGIELGRLHVRDHAGLEATDEALLHFWNLLRINVGRDDDLA